jgi:PAS domain S-box-containing protein
MFTNTKNKPDIPQEILDKWQRIINLMAMTVGVPAGLIMKVDPPEIEVFISSKTEKNPYHKGEKANLNTGLYCETVIQKCESLLVPDATKDPVWDHNPDIKLGMIYYQGFPLEWPDSQIFGTICVLDFKDNPNATTYKNLIHEFKIYIETDLELILKRDELDKESQKIRESEKKYSDLFNKMINGFALHEIIIDENDMPYDYRFIEVNPAFEDMTGLKKENIIGKTILEILPNTERYWIETYGKIALEGKSVRFSNYSTELNKYFDVLAFSPKKGFFATLFTDVTEQKIMQDKLREATTIINNSHVIVFTWRNAEGWPVEYVSENVTSIMGHTPEEFIEGKVSYSNCIHPEDLPRVIEEVRKFSSDKDQIEFTHEPYRIITKDGIKVVSDWTYIVRNPKGNITHYKGIVEDITEKKIAEENIKSLNEALRVLNKILRHDILNDLTVVMTSCDMINTDNDNLKQKAENSIKKSVSLIEQMRELEKALISEEELSEKSLRSVVESTIKNYSDIRFSVTGDCTILCDNAIFSVIDNIVRNAIVHGKTYRIDIPIEEKNGNCDIKFIDYGKGIPDDIKSKILEEGESFGETRGSGLGLYIVKKVVERYGGEITVEDNKPNGAVFVLKFKKS